MPKHTFTKEEKKEYRQKQQQDINEMFKKIEKGVADVFESENFKEYLRFCSKFTNYSLNNTLLIAMQKPDASLVAAFGKWKSLGRYVKKGEKGIEILAPVSYKTSVKKEVPETDEFGNKVYNDDGTEKTVTKSEIAKQLSFKKIHVFDVSQTEGKELPTLMDELQGEFDEERKEAIFKGVRKAVGIDIDYDNIRSGAKGYYSITENRIVINEGMSDLQTLKTLFHEAAHSILHNPELNLSTLTVSRNEKEVQAESTAFIIASRYGIDTSEYSFPYIASWAEKHELTELRQYLSDIQSTAKKICDSIDHELLKLQVKNLSIDELSADETITNVQKAQIIIDRKSDEGIKFEQGDIDNLLKIASENKEPDIIIKAIEDTAEIQKQRDSYGYDFTYMNPIDSVEKALELFDKGEAVYLLYPDNTESQALERYEIESFDGYFGIEKEKPEKTREIPLVEIKKDEALEAWDNGLDIYIDGIAAQSRSEIESSEMPLYINDNEVSASQIFDTEKEFSNTNGEQLSFLGEPEPLITEKEEKKSEFSPGPIVDGVQVYEALYAEIDRGTGFVDGKIRVQEFYEKMRSQPNHPTIKELADCLKKEYGTGGHSGEGNISLVDYNSNGMVFSFENGEKFRHSWGNVATAVESKLRNNTYLSPDQLAKCESIKAQRSMKENYEPYKIVVEDRFLNKVTNVIYEVTALDDTDNYTVKHLSGANEIEESISYDDLNSGLYKYIEKSEQEIVQTSPEQSEPTPDIAHNTNKDTINDNEIDDTVTHKYNSHSANLIIQQLKTDRVPYQAQISDNTTSIIVSSSDEAAFKQSFERAKEKTANLNKIKDYSKTPVYQESFNYAKEHNELGEFYEFLNAIKACDKFISENIDIEAANRNMKGFVNTIHEKFGDTIPEYVISKSLTDKGVSSKNNFKFNIKSFKPLINIDSKLSGALLADFQNMKQAEIRTFKLSSYFNNKHLLPLPRTKLVMDERGLPITQSENSSRNETYVKGYGWLNNEERDKVHKEYGKADFHTLVEKINVSYIDDNGRYGQMDITPDEYSAFSDRTYSQENKERYEAAKAKYEELKSSSNINNTKEYYAVSQVSENRYVVMNIGADGTMEAVTDKLSKRNAVKAATDIFNRKNKNKVAIEFVSPEKLSQISIDIFKSQKPNERDPERLYKVFPNPLKNTPSEQSHFVQEYRKDGDKYKEVGVAMTGTLDACQKYAHEATNKKQDPTYKIYQLKSGEDNHEYRFTSLSELNKYGLSLEYGRYEKKYEAPLSDVQKSDLPTTLNSIYEKFNIDIPGDFKGHSLSVSDIVVLDKSPYFVDRIGFKKVQNFLPEQKIEYMQQQYMKELDKRIAEATTPEQLQALAEEGNKLGLDIQFTANEHNHDKLLDSVQNKPHLIQDKNDIKQNRRAL